MVTDLVLIATKLVGHDKLPRPLAPALQEDRKDQS